MSKEQDLLLGVLGKTLKMSPDEVRGLIYDGEDVSETAMEKILNADADRVKRIRKETETDAFNNGHKKGLAETMTTFEQSVRDKYGVKTDKQGLELIEDVVLANQKSNLGADDVRKHPAYLDLERNTVRKDEYNKVVSDYESFKKKLDRDKMMDKVHNKALSILDKLNPQIEEDSRVAERRKRMFLQEFDDYDYEFEDDLGMIMPVKDGKRVMDKHGNPVGFESYVRQVAERNFVLSQQQMRQSSGNTNGGTISINVPRTKEEYLKAIVAEKDPQKRIMIKKAYEKQQEG